MIIVFDGAEKPSHRTELERSGVTSFGFSFWRARQRGFPKTKAYRLEEYFAEDAVIFVDSGWSQVEKAEWSDAEAEAYCAEYDDFLDNNADRIAGATELHVTQMGMDWIKSNRLRDDFGTLIWPIWNPNEGQLMLARLAEDYDNVAIPNSAVDDAVLPSRINALSRQHQTSFHLLNTAKPDLLRSANWETASTLSWTSPQMRGETIIWDGSRLVRYPKKMKDQARSRYKNAIEKAGMDFSKVVADDPIEVTRLAIWSYKQLEKSMNRDFDVTNSDFDPPEPEAEKTPTDVANRGSGMRNSIVPRDPDKMRVLPVFGVEYKQIVETENGVDVVKQVPVLRSTDTSLRQCNTCILASNCPAFEPDASCAFGLPVEVKTKEQLRSLLNAMIEMQGQRVAFARFAEELNGGYPDPNLSQEIDRLFKLVKNIKDLESNNEFARITVERQTSGGVLSALFGERAEVLHELPQPVQSDDVIRGVIEGHTE
jgi:hypothetical protein